MSEVLEATAVDADGKIACMCCSERVHVIALHLRDHHPEVTLEDYKGRFPGAPIYSPVAEKRLEEKRAEAARKAASAAPEAGETVALQSGDIEITGGHLHEVFGLGNVPAAMRKSGDPLPIQTFKAPAHLAVFVPDRDPNYVFPIEELKYGLMALSANIPAYFWGMMGTGKSSIWEQIMAHTGRPWMRVQHTRNTEESHIAGQWVVRDGQTIFELGPLAFCMKYGLTYLADEYDFAMPSVTALYQPVLEGKPLLIKEADAANRIIRPHPLFRMVATGNTNGQGDETGLYQGTLLQNAANYERFGIVREIHYPSVQAETMLVSGQGKVKKEIAEKLVNLANMCREAYRAQKIGLPPSPRALINAATVGRMTGDMAEGFTSAYINRLNRVDAEAVREILKRVKL